MPSGNRITRTKTAQLAEFRAMMDLRTNSSNNTVYAEADGNIAYFHGNFVPRRDPRFDYSRSRLMAATRPPTGTAAIRSTRLVTVSQPLGGLDPEHQRHAIYRRRR